MGSTFIVGKFHHIVDCQKVGHFLHVVCRAHIGKCPAFGLQLFNQTAKGRGCPFAGRILQSIGQDRDHGSRIGVILDTVVQACQRLAHRIVERRASTRHIVSELLDLRDGLVVNHRPHIGSVTRVESDKRQRMILRLLKLLLGTADGSNRLVDSRKGCFPQVSH